MMKSIALLILDSVNLKIVPTLPYIVGEERYTVPKDELSQILIDTSYKLSIEQVVSSGSVKYTFSDGSRIYIRLY